MAATTAAIANLMCFGRWEAGMNAIFKKKMS
jgi:hypothetical protein